MDRSLASNIRRANSTLITNGDREAVGQFFTPDYVAHLTDRDMEGGYGWIPGFIEMLQRAFPDLQIEVEILLEGKDRVAWQRKLRGTHQGDFMGFPACGRQIVWRDMITSRFRDGLIAEEWVITDLAERLLLARSHDESQRRTR
jgi:predicted ester cyclase